MNPNPVDRRRSGRWPWIAFLLLMALQTLALLAPRSSRHAGWFAPRDFRFLSRGVPADLMDLLAPGYRDRFVFASKPWYSRTWPTREYSE